VTDEQGRRLSCVFTHEAELAERFGACDQSVVSSLRFADVTAGRVTDAAQRPSTAGAAPQKKR